MMRKVIFLVLGAALQGTVVGCSSLRVESPETQALAAAQVHGADASRIRFEQDVSPLLTTYCTVCHTGPSAPAAVALDFQNEEEARGKAIAEDGFWSRVARNVSAKQMPPVYAPMQPTDAERAVLVDWINDNVLTPTGAPDPGPFLVRRLNNREYANTLRDLLYLPADYDVASDFPADQRGDGFDNNAGTLTISPLLIEHFLAAAEKATVVALGLDPSVDRDESSFSRSKLNEPSAGINLDFSDWQAQVRLNMETFAPRAFRRPVTSEEIDELMRFAALSFTHSGLSAHTFDEATGLAIRAALLSPEFLFRLERDPDPDGTGKVYEVSEYQLASRLSYFLWSSMPDDELFIAARDGTLRANLDAHIARMLKDPKAISLTTDFLGQWLEIRGLEQVPNVPRSLLTAMKGETEHFFDYIVREDRSIMDFLDAGYSFVNEPLAQLYGIPGVTGEAFQRVEVDRSRRGGIFTQASFLTLTSKPLGDSLRTSPVMRGKWILENIFNESIPPPPPDVPELEFVDDGVELKGTVRQIFEQHREDPTCASCHARMDPYGFALENYDGFGAWRDQDNQVDVDASGEIDGRFFTTPVEFRAILAEREDDFRNALVRKMLSYGLGRSIQGYDRRALDEISAAVKEDGDSFSSLIINIAKSYPFQNARGSVSRTAETAPAATAPAELFHPVRVKPEEVPDPDSDPVPGPGPTPLPASARVGLVDEPQQETP
jgi:mono/diheme cytochrome c family protein